MRPWLAALGLVVALAVVAPAGAVNAPHVQQRIEPGKSIGKVKIGMTFAQVRKALGKPEYAFPPRKLGFGKTWTEYSWNFTSWRVGFVNGRVTSISASVRTEKTKEGVGVGTLGSRVQRIYGIRECIQGFDRETEKGMGMWCVVTTPGGAKTAFVLGTRCKTREGPYRSCTRGEFLPPEVMSIHVFARGQQLPVVLRRPVPQQPVGG